MAEIRCPKCNTFFQIDESDYGKIVSQVRDAEFSKEMAFRVQHYEKEKADAISIVQAEDEKRYSQIISRTREELTGEIAAKDSEIAELQAKIDKFELEKSIAVKSAEDAKDDTISQKDAEIVEGYEAKKNPKYEVYTDKAGETRFRLNAGNGQIIAVSEGYKAKKSALNGIDSIQRNAPDAEIVEELE